MQPGCRVARFPGGEAPPLTAPADVPASFFPTSSVAQNTFLNWNLVHFYIYNYKKKTLLFCYSFHQLDSGESFNLMAPCVPRHLLPGESFQTISTACVLNSTRILMQHWSFGWLDRVVKLGLGGDCLSLFWIKWNSHSKSISLFFLHVLLCVSI